VATARDDGGRGSLGRRENRHDDPAIPLLVASRGVLRPPLVFEAGAVHGRCLADGRSTPPVVHNRDIV
jgi:hypothetical protein